MAIFLVCSIAVILISTGDIKAEDSAKPNVLIIYSDDQGSVDLGVMGANDLATPYLDRLAQEGLLLKQMYAPAPVCSASRVGLLTGRFPARAGQPANGPLKSEEVTIAECFSEAGYRTGQVGKWHLGSSPAQVPSAQGFQYWFGHLNGCIDNYSHFYFWSGPNRHDLYENGKEIYRPGEYFPDLMAMQCLEFIDSEDERPWLLYWAINAPHYPYQGKPRWLEHYANLPSPRKEYCSWISTMDETVGTVVDHLRRSGQLDNTIVIFQPDHGHSTEERAFGGGGNAGIYRGAKFSLFEGGIRVPAFIRYPEKLPSGETRTQLLHGCDWLPTLCELCEVQKPRDADGKLIKLDGISIVASLVDDDVLQRPPIYWQLGRGENSQRGLRLAEWKLITNPSDTTLPERDRRGKENPIAKIWLSNVALNPAETINYADQNPEMVRKLKKLETELRLQWE